MGVWRTALGGMLLMASVGLPAQDRITLTSTNLPLSPGPAVDAPALAPATAAGPNVLAKNDVDTWLEGYMPYALRSADIPGAVVVVVKDGQVLTARGFGYADVAKRTPVDPARTLFREGSVSKLVTWTAVMQLVEAGSLDLDADVNHYLDFHIAPVGGRALTMRQLMTHTGGFEEVAKGLIGYDAARNPTLEKYLKGGTPAQIFTPGSTPAYSNWGTALAGYIVQRISGEDFDTYLDRHVFAPLGMRNSTFRQPLPAGLAGQMATAYPKPGESGGFEYIAPGPAGALSATGPDMARFMIAHLQRGSLDGQRILRPETADMMHDSPLTKVDPRSLIPPLNRMELGFFETNINGREVIGHLGDTLAFHTSLHLFMKEGVGLFVSFNSPGKAAAVQALRTAIFEDFADRYFPNIAPSDGRVGAKTAAEHARMMTGRWIASRRADTSFLGAVYWLQGQTVISVGPKGELVVPSVVNAGGRPRQWVEIAPFVWRDVAGHELLAAQLVGGKVVRWSFNFAAPFEVFDRVPAHLSAGWIIPALAASLLVLLLAFLFWPTAWFVRRHFGAAPLVAGRALKAQRATRLMAGLDVALVVAWAVTVTEILAKDGGDGSGDWLLWLLQIAGVVIFFGAALMAGWNLWLTWTDKRRWPRRTWSALVLLATLVLLYVAVTFGLVALTVHY
ncbi:MAG: serine hydrolase domain-containing protein [Janthinobacterium lividum]